MVERLKIGSLYQITYGCEEEDTPWDDLLVVLEDDGGQYLVRLLASQCDQKTTRDLGLTTESFHLAPYRIEKATEISEKELPLYINWPSRYPDFDWYFKKEV
jgi:hypothetical protein